MCKRYPEIFLVLMSLGISFSSKLFVKKKLITAYHLIFLIKDNLKSNTLMSDNPEKSHMHRNPLQKYMHFH